MQQTDADEPVPASERVPLLGGIPSLYGYQEGIERRLQRVSLAVYGYAANAERIIAALNDEGFAVMDKPSGSEARA